MEWRTGVRVSTRGESMLAARTLRDRIERHKATISVNEVAIRCMWCGSFTCPHASTITWSRHPNTMYTLLHEEVSA